MCSVTLGAKLQLSFCELFSVLFFLRCSTSFSVHKVHFFLVVVVVDSQPCSVVLAVLTISALPQYHASVAMSARDISVHYHQNVF